MSTPECPICVNFLCEPITLGCGHSYCRLCLAQAKRLAPDGSVCPLCRAAVGIEHLASHPVDEELTSRVVEDVSPETYAAQQRAHQEKLEALLADSTSSLPVYFMTPGISTNLRTGRKVSLHFFEQRYRILSRRAWESNRLFIFCSRPPQIGMHAAIVRIDSAQFDDDGGADIVGTALLSVQLVTGWVEEGTGGLHYAKVEEKAVLSCLPASDAGSESTTGGRPVGAVGAAAATGAQRASTAASEQSTTSVQRHRRGRRRASSECAVM